MKIITLHYLTISHTQGLSKLIVNFNKQSPINRTKQCLFVYCKHIGYILYLCHIDLYCLCLPDEVIKRKLLLEGERGGDDTRLNNLLKTFIKWCNASDQDDDSYV